MVNLDGVNLFGEGESQIEIGSYTRESIERSATGLDGVVSIDLGGRERKIRQKGELRARSTEELNKKAEAIQAFMDGDTHTLVASQGRIFENLIVDSVSVKNERASGAGVVADYEIVYMQLMV
jgi:phage tail tube protein FII